MARTHTTPSSSDSLTYDERVDEFIANSAAFAQPILRYVRGLIHEAMPDANEEIKWSRPFFTVNGISVCYIAAFTKHCALGFWSPGMTALLQNDGVDGSSGAGSMGKITAVEDLPPREDLLRYFKEAAKQARSRDAVSPMKTRARTSAKAPSAVSPEFAHALAKSGQASITFERLPPSCRREYLQWIASAKRPETRERRISQAVAKLETGKRFGEQ